MNDRHLDPPETPEPPDWYCQIEEALEDPHIPESVATAIRKILEDWCAHDDYPEDYEPPLEELPDDDVCMPEHCPHQKPWGQCDACDYLGDLAYDAARERR